MWSPSSIALASGLSSTAPTPSAGTNPSPPDPKLRQRPSVEDMVISACVAYLLGCSDRFTPPAIAHAHSPRLMLSQARWIAVSDDEHMVSTAMLGPCKSSA